MNESALNVTVQTEDGGVVWQENAAAVSSFNSQGLFDILPQHANFITIIKGRAITIHQSEGQPKVLHFQEAVLYVKENGVRIYAISR